MNAAIYECRPNRHTAFRACYIGADECANERRINTGGVLDFLDHVKTKMERGQELTPREQATLDEVSEYLTGIVKEFMALIEKYVVPTMVEFAKMVQEALDAFYVAQQPTALPDLIVPIEVNIPPLLIDPPGRPMLSPWLGERFMERGRD